MGAHGKIFISYRREDAPGDARGICDRLGRSFGEANVFMDVDRLLAGQRFDRQLNKALAQCDVLVAVIGSRWMELLSGYVQSGKRDYVRDEIAAAMQRDIIVIPVMTGREANIPPLPLTEDLPENIRDLVMYQKHTVAHETFGRDAADLVAALKTVLLDKRGPRPWRAIAATAVVALALIGASVGYWMDILPRRQPGVPQGDVAANSTASALMNSAATLKKAEEEARQQEAANKEEADAKLADDAARRKAAEDQAAQQARDAEMARKKAEADAKAADDAAKTKVAEEQAARRAADAEAAKKKAEAGAQAGEPGDAAGSYALGRRYENAQGVPRDLELARRWYEKAAALGNVAAMYSLGRLYANGPSAFRDLEQARKWYEKAAEQGHAAAMRNLGYYYAFGIGGERDNRLAISWYERAARAGDAATLAGLPGFCRQGFNLDSPEVRNCYETAAELGNVSAMLELGILYEEGLGVAKDSDQARNWYQKAANAGNEDAKTKLKNLR